MNPIQNTDNYIRLDKLALETAERYLYHCNDNTEGSIRDKKEEYEVELERIYYSDRLETDTRIRSVDDVSYDLEVHPEFAENWQEKKLAPPPGMCVSFGLIADKIITDRCLTLPPLRNGQHQDAGQTRLVELIQNLADEREIGSHNLSSPSLHRHIHNARQRVKENY